MPGKKTEVINVLEEQVSNDGAYSIIPPYTVEVTITGDSKILFHRWSDDDVAAKAKAAKNSAAKKTDNLEAYVYRDEKGDIAIPGEYLRQSIIRAAKFRQDPRSKRKSAYDLFKAGITSMTDLASCGTACWDFVDRRRVMIQRNGVTRERPGLYEGWSASFLFSVLLPEYIDKALLHSVITDAGRLEGIGDFRPTFGRFQIVRFEAIN